MTSYLFSIPEIEQIILQNIKSIVDWYQLMLINKYFYQIIINQSIYLEFKDYYYKKDSLTINTKFNSIVSDQKDFIKTCQNGYINVAKFLFEKYPDMFVQFPTKLSKEISECYLDGHRTFHFYVDKQSVESDKIISVLSNSPIELNNESDCLNIFRNSCLCGGLSLVQMFSYKTIGHYIMGNKQF